MILSKLGLERPRSPWEVHAETLGLRGAQVGNLWRNVSKVGYAVTLRACSVPCRYLAVASKGRYGYGLSRSGRAT